MVALIALGFHVCRRIWSSFASLGATPSVACQRVLNQPATVVALLILVGFLFNDGDTIDIEPWRSPSFPILKDLIVDRSAFDRIIQAGGYISAPTGAALAPQRRCAVRMVQRQRPTRT